jgi:hypothetical protein
MYRLALFLASAALLTSNVYAFDFDGKYDPTQYDRTFDVSYYVDCSGGCSAKGNTVTGQFTVSGGTLALTTVQESNGSFTQYMFYSHPLGFKDNSYVADVSAADAAKYLVGWQTDDAGTFVGQKSTSYVGSEYFEFNLNGQNVKVDYDQQTPYENDSGGNNVTAISTAGYNKQFGNAFQDHSPETVDCGDESSSDISCYQLAATAANAGVDWQFAAGVELKLTTGTGAKYFDVDTASMTLAQAESLIQLVATHASPSKFTSAAKEPDDRIICDPTITGTPCYNNPGPGPGPGVPEPGTLALMGLALCVPAARARVKRA